MIVAKVFVVNGKLQVCAEPFTWTYPTLAEVANWLRVNRCVLRQGIRHIVTGRVIGWELYLEDRK